MLAGIGGLEVQNVSGLNFQVDKEENYKKEARRQAIMKARADAETLAHDLGVTLVRVINYSESGYYPPIYYKGMETMMADGGRGGLEAPSPEVPVGENKITSSVTITYEIR